MSTEKDGPGESDIVPVPKARYERPALVIHGDKRAVTRTPGGTLGMNDGAGGRDKSGYPPHWSTGVRRPEDRPARSTSHGAFAVGIPRPVRR